MLGAHTLSRAKKSKSQTLRHTPFPSLTRTLSRPSLSISFFLSQYKAACKIERRRLAENTAVRERKALGEDKGLGKGLDVETAKDVNCASTPDAG